MNVKTRIVSLSAVFLIISMLTACGGNAAKDTYPSKNINGFIA